MPHPPTDHLFVCPPWGIYVLAPFLVVLLFFLGICLCATPRGLVALLCLVQPSVVLGGGCCLIPFFPTSLLCLCLRRS